MSDKPKVNWTDEHTEAVRPIPEPRTRLAIQRKQSYVAALDIGNPDLEKGILADRDDGDKPRRR